MNIVTPKEFSRAFGAVVDRRKQEIANCWHPGRVREYTSLFLGDEKCVLQDVAQELNLLYAAPWWTLDAIFFEEFDKVHFRERFRMAKYLSVAIEHENFVNRATYQTNKLSIYNAPLKVLITYPRLDWEESEWLDLLTQCSRILEDGDILGDFSHRRRHLVVLGSESHGSADESDSILWRYFTYEHRKFVEILA